MRYRMGSFGPAEESYRAVRRLASQDSVAKARSLLKVARVQGGQDRYRRRCGRSPWDCGTRRRERRAGRAATGATARWYARFCSRRATRKTIKWCHLAIEAAEFAGEKEAHADVLQVLDWTYEESGRLDLATNLPRALQLYEEISDLPARRASTSLGTPAHARGDLPSAKEYFARALEIARRTGDAVMVGVCTNNIGETAFDQGHVDEAGALLRDALPASRPSGMRVRNGARQTQPRAGRVLDRSP